MLSICNSTLVSAIETRCLQRPPALIGQWLNHPVCEVNIEVQCTLYTSTLRWNLSIKTTKGTKKMYSVLSVDQDLHIDVYCCNCVYVLEVQ